MNIKQNPIHKISIVGSAVSIVPTLWLLCTAAAAAEAPVDTTSFSGAVANVRLIAGRTMANGAYRIGISIAMSSGSHTYWKEPGDAGVPPVFAFNGSSNVADATVLFPLPTRITEDGLTAFGYTDTVVFPVVVKPADASKPSMVDLDMSYAVCNKICMPGHATVDLALPAPASDGQDQAVTAAFDAVPKALPPAAEADLAVTPIRGEAKNEAKDEAKDEAKPSWTLTWTGGTPLNDVFVDAPEGYAFDTRRGAAPQTWTLVGSAIVAAPNVKTVPITITLAEAGRGFVTRRTLDLPPRKP